MAPPKKKGDPPPPEEWDGLFDGPAGPEGAPMPARAAKLPSQNPGAMRAVFAHLLDEDAPEPPADPKKRRKP